MSENGNKVMYANYKRAWAVVQALLLLVKGAGVERVDVGCVVELMNEVLIRGSGKFKIDDSMSMVNLCAGEEVMGYIDGAGRLVGLKDCNLEVGSEKYEERFKLGERVGDLLLGGEQ